MVKIVRGDVWLTTLDPTVGSEIQKTRPCVVISPPEINEYLRTVIVAPMTTGGRLVTCRIPIQFGGKKGLMLLDQIRAIDKTRLISKVGRVNPKTLDAALATLQDMFSN